MPHQHQPTTARHRLIEQWSLRATDAGIASVLLLAPLFFGGRHGLGLLVYAGVVCFAAVAQTVHNAFAQDRGPRIGVAPIAILALSAGVVALQLAPLPSGLLTLLSQEAQSRLTYAAWNRLSVEPWSTKISLAALLTHAVLFCVIARRVRCEADVKQLVKLTAVAGGAMAVLALLQYASRTDYLLGVYPLAFRRASNALIGSFTTPNHCGHYLAVTAGAVLYCLLESWRNVPTASRQRSAKRAFDWRRHSAPVCWLAVLLLIGAAVLLTFSRGAVLSLTISMVTCGLLLARAGWINGRVFGQAVVIGVLAVTGLSLADFERTSKEAGGASLSDIEKLTDTSARSKIWQANLRAFAASPWVGHGAGAHAVVYPMFMEEPTTVVYTHAESGYLQVATEAGLAGLLLLGGAVALTVGWCARGVLFSRSGDTLALWAVIAAALATSLAHSVADFVWYIPACLAPVVMLAAAAERLTALRVPTQPDSPRPTVSLPFTPIGWVGVLASAMCVAALHGPGLAALDRDDYDRSSVALKRYTASLRPNSSHSDPEEQRQRAYATQLFYVEQMLEALSRASERDPANPRTQLRIARLELQEFEMRQQTEGGGLGLDAIGQVAYSGQFESPQAVREWVARAYGEEGGLLLDAYRRALSAVRGSPLEGEGYLQLANLAFLNSIDKDTPSRLTSQALAVRPYDGMVLFEAGRRRYYAGQVAEAMELWRRAAVQRGAHRARLAAVGAALLPAEEFVSQFKPDWELTRAAFDHYSELGAEDGMRVLARHAVTAAYQEAQGDNRLAASRQFCQASYIQASLEDYAAAVQCAREAQQLTPNQYHVRACLANALYRAEEYEQADPHIRWCLARHPDDQTLRYRLEQIAKQRNQQRMRLGTARTALWSSPAKAVEPSEEEPTAEE